MKNIQMWHVLVISILSLVGTLGTSLWMLLSIKPKADKPAPEMPLPASDTLDQILTKAEKAHKPGKLKRLK